MFNLQYIADPSALIVLAILGILILAGLTKGVIGVGMPIVAIPLLTTVVSLPAAVGLLTVPLVITNFAQATSGEPASGVLRRLLPILAGMTLGIAVGVFLLTTLHPIVLKPIVGAVLISLAGLMLLSPKLSCPDRFERVASPVAGLAGGLLGGLAAQPGPLVFLYLLSRGITGARFVQHSSMYVLVSSIILAIGLGSTGTYSWPGAAISALCALPVMAGMRLGAGLRGRVPDRVLRALILAVVFLGGVSLITQGSHARVAVSTQNSEN